VPGSRDGTSFPLGALKLLSCPFLFFFFYSPCPFFFLSSFSIFSSRVFHYFRSSELSSRLYSEKGHAYQSSIWHVVSCRLTLLSARVKWCSGKSCKTSVALGFAMYAFPLHITLCVVVEFMWHLYTSGTASSTQFCLCHSFRADDMERVRFVNQHGVAYRCCAQVLSLLTSSASLFSWRFWSCFFSGSMEPGFHRGDLLFLTNPEHERYHTGDITVYRVPKADIPIVHRVLETHDYEEGEDRYVSSVACLAPSPSLSSFVLLVNSYVFL
jgi:hypothetical protein